MIFPELSTSQALAPPASIPEESTMFLCPKNNSPSSCPQEACPQPVGTALTVRRGVWGLAPGDSVGTAGKNFSNLLLSHRKSDSKMKGIMSSYVYSFIKHMFI